MPSDIAKLEAHAEHLLDGFITLRERYAMLRPMLHNKDVVENKGSKKQYRGFIIIRNALFLFCCQAIVNLCFDKDVRCPSISQTITKLENNLLRAKFKKKYSDWTAPVIGEQEPEILKILELMEKNEKLEREVAFDNHFQELLALWASFSTSKSALSLEKIRNKVAAHTDISLIDGKYKLFDISSLDLQWDDIKMTITDMQTIIDLINLLVRNSGYHWVTLDEILCKTVNDYWEISHVTE
ncbi:MAG: hypothetical protein H7Z70_07685 [Bacteroidia bacterium]|nr:hypothetical protein [Methylotenera sp.]